MSRKPLGEIPFNHTTGHMESFPGYNAEWRPNDPFTASLRIVGKYRGMSAHRFILENPETGVQYPLFMAELLAIAQNHVIDRGVITGKWIGCQRGQNYSLRLMEEGE